ncbi:hypothetical protein CEXT_384221 [Caerostris extrusa]|uniref:Uncharacterized protein n=1 Tax=Caerostris extrusa TaxID=172846 RepID=A0AAV4QNG2_CAEEX|nr:hypothetical protein CEXT_384221 [Caerostris extrusa]
MYPSHSTNALSTTIQENYARSNFHRDWTGVLMAPSSVLFLVHYGHTIYLSSEDRFLFIYFYTYISVFAKGERRTKRIKVKRRILRSSVTKLIRRAVEELVRDDKNPDILNDNLTVLLEHKETLEGLNKSIECLINDDDNELEIEIEGYFEYTESIVFCKLRVNRYLGNLNKLQKLSSLNLYNVITESEKKKLKTDMKLPRKSLDRFSSDFCRFQEFRPQHEAAIHENENLQ